MSFSYPRRRGLMTARLILLALLGACSSTPQPVAETQTAPKVSVLASDPAWIELGVLASKHGFSSAGTTAEGRIRLNRAGTEVQIDPQSRVSFFAGQLVLMSERPRQDLGATYVVAALDRDFANLSATNAASKAATARTSSAELKKIPGGRLVGRHFVLDAGHGGKDSGATEGGLMEKHVVLDITLQVGALLRARGAEVTFTRTDDRFISLEERAAISNRVDPHAFLSIHVNSAANKSARGIEVFRAKHAGSGARSDKVSKSSSLATALERKLAQVTPTKDRGVKDSPGFRVLKLNHHPSVLLELGFVTNTEERGRLGSAPYRLRLAEAIVQGLEDWSARN